MTINRTDGDYSEIPPHLRPYLDEIAKRLHTKHSAVMIGAGMSSNATKSIHSDKDFPNWDDLGNLLLTELKYQKPLDNARFLNIPTLAQEYEATFGRPALDKLIHDAIPDSDYEPSSLHTAVLNLPWTDVFTTNYDTLLERASRTSTTQRYDHVIRQQDLLSAERPRIIKLHGSLRSAERLVITEEDYRSYPTNFAPLLNTVRQSLLENTLCMIGFSGNDPNFLQWIGWIHDHLGHENSPKMYLITLSPFSETKTQLLRERNIVVVDMSTVSQGSSATNSSGLGVFLDYLEAQRPNFENLNWPPLNGEGSSFTPTSAAIVSLIEKWRRDRLNYPGWVVVPENRRIALRRDIAQYINKLWARNSAEMPELEHGIDLDVSYETIWRMEKCLYPILDNQIPYFEAVLDRHWSSAKPSRSPRHEQDEDTAQRLHEFGTKYHHVLLAVMRFYREEGLTDEWNKVSNRLNECLPTLSPEHKATYYYEKSMAALYDLDPQNLRKRLREWPVDQSLPFWEAKRAGILAEIGQTDEAEVILQTCLRLLRSKSNLKPVEGDYTILSQESIVMLLLQRIPLRMGNFTQYIKTQKEFESRWHKLQEYNCNPTFELRLFELALHKLVPALSEVTQKPTFDIGRIVHTVSFQNQDSEAANAYSLLRFCEDIGLPLRSVKPSTQGALSRIIVYSPHWATVSLIRLGEGRHESVNTIFGRTWMANMEVAYVDNLVQRFVHALSLAQPEIQSADNMWDRNFGLQLANILPEVLSRLVTKCSPSAKLDILRLLGTIYDSKNRGAYAGTLELTHRLVKSLSQFEVGDVIAGLLDFPVLSELTEAERHSYVNPFLFVRHDQWPAASFPSLSNAKFRDLLGKGASVNANERQWVLRTLSTFYVYDSLTDDQALELGDVLWQRVDESGWPSDTDFHWTEFMQLPHPDDREPSGLFMQQLVDSRFQNAPEPGTSSIGGDRRSVFHDIQWACRNLELEQADVTDMLERCLYWWNEYKPKPDQLVMVGPFAYNDSDLKKVVLDVVNAVVELVQASREFQLKSEIKEGVQQLTLDLVQRDLPTRRLESATFGWFLDSQDEVVRSIRSGLASSSIETIMDALGGVRILMEEGYDSPVSQISQVVSDLLHYVCQFLFWRKKPGLFGAIELISHAISTRPSIFSDELEWLVLNGLQKLIGETSPQRLSSQIRKNSVDEMDDADDLLIRQGAARLAFVLSKHHSDEVLPSVIADWQSICSSDHEFAEIRNEWWFDSR